MVQKELNFLEHPILPTILEFKDLTVFAFHMLLWNYSILFFTDSLSTYLEFTESSNS